MWPWQWARTARLFALLDLIVLTVVEATAIRDASTRLAEAQRAKSTKGFDADAIAALKNAVESDYLFILVYTLLLVFVFLLIRDPSKPDKPDRRHPAALSGIVLTVVGALADVAENRFLVWAFDGDATRFDHMRAAGLVKWGALIAALLTLAVLLILKSWREPLVIGHPAVRPPDPNPPAGSKHRWDPPAKEAKTTKTGVCLSGGGIRSAAFSLGALQALRKEGKLDNAAYLAAASGGGYLAAGWAISQAGPPGDGDPANNPPRWDPGSPEERWFRDHASYLIPDFKGGVAGIARLLAGLLVNVLVVALVLFAVSRPVGWAMHAMHEKTLKATDPTVLARGTTADMKVFAVQDAGLVSAGTDEGPINRYKVTVVPATAQVGEPPPAKACFDLWKYDPADKDGDVCVNVDGSTPAVVDVQAGRAKVVSQPKVKVVVDEGCEDKSKPEYKSDVCKVQRAAGIQGQPTLSLENDVMVHGLAPTVSQFTVSKQPTVLAKTGLAVMTWPKYRSWMWELTGGLFLAAFLVSLVVMATRPRGQKGDIGRALARALAGTGLGVFVVAIALPWLVIWLPRTLASLDEVGTKSVSGSSLFDYLLPSGGLLALFVPAVAQFFAGSKSKDGSGAGASKPIYVRAWNALAKRSSQLKWYETSPMKIVVALVASIGTVVVFINALQFAAANGVEGRLMGFAFIRDHLPEQAFVHDYWKLVAVLAFLGIFALAADAQSWSLYPFYKQRLSSAFLLRRKAGSPGRAEPIPYDALLPFSHLEQSEGPELIACCAVNLNEYGVVPPGRRAASFTFSSKEIGGPIVGYATPADYAGLPVSRQRDTTVASAMAISGAAFSPAMGKFNLGPVGMLLALANLRLGVWIPHPRRLTQQSNKRWHWQVMRPHWVWFLRELTNKYAFNRRYVYVSDGGHWDNLGLVELLRRGCTEIYCISGAGDGPQSFGTIGEAIALAREELGVEIKLDPSPLRSPTEAPKPAPERELRREGSKDKAGVYAAAAAVKGTYTFTRSPGAADGVIYYVEADLTADMPFDAHVFAESETVFPDDSTGDQVFNHRQFESYRVLGWHQACAAVKLTQPPAEPDPPEIF